MSSRTIVFVHGMYMTPLCWEQWGARFQTKGYRCLAPAWPGRDKPIDLQRQNHPDPELGRLTLRNVIDHLAKTIQALDEKPVLIGHSMGGLIVQLLRQRGLAAATVAIDSAPPLGVISTRWSFIKANFPHINPFMPQGSPIRMTFEQFQYAFMNGHPLEEQRTAFEKYIVPESRRVPGQSLTWAAKIDFKKPGTPLLFVGGSNDHIIPASLNRTNAAKYERSGSTIDFKEFPGRTHFIIAEKNWEEVADHVLSWLNAQGK